MKKRLIPVALVAAISAPLFTSCIGSFALTNKLLSWNNSIGSKIVNELCLSVSGFFPYTKCQFLPT